MPAEATAFITAVQRLTERLAGANPGWYAARAGGRDGVGPRRVDVLRALVWTLAEFGREAENGAPAGAVPHDVGVHALADQITVLAADLASAPGLTAQFLERGTAQVSTAYDALWPPVRPRYR